MPGARLATWGGQVPGTGVQVPRSASLPGSKFPSALSFLIQFARSPLLVLLSFFSSHFLDILDLDVDLFLSDALLPLVLLTLSLDCATLNETAEPMQDSDNGFDKGTAG